jgi:hypothetical protein
MNHCLEDVWLDLTCQWPQATFAKVQSVDTSDTTVSLQSLLRGLPVGSWVVLDAGMRTVLGTAHTPEEALRNAHVKTPDFESVVGERPVMLQVPDPSLMCFY